MNWTGLGVGQKRCDVDVEQSSMLSMDDEGLPRLLVPKTLTPGSEDYWHRCCSE